MSSYFPKEFIQKTVNEMFENWLTTTHPPETTVGRESEKWYTIWIRKVEKQNFHNFNVDARNEDIVTKFVAEFSKMEDRFAPRPNGISGPEESPVLGSGGFKSASHQATGGGGFRVVGDRHQQEDCVPTGIISRELPLQPRIRLDHS
jgi:hypothetical protein